MQIQLLSVLLQEIEFIKGKFHIQLFFKNSIKATTTTDEDGNTAEPTDPPSTISTSTHSQGTNAQGYPTPPPMPGQDPSVRDLDFPVSSRNYPISLLCLYTFSSIANGPFP